METVLAATDGPEDGSWKEKGLGRRDVEADTLDAPSLSVVDSPLTQIIGVMILEFGVLLHRCGVSCVSAVRS